MKRLGILVSGSGSNMQAIVEACRGGVLAEMAEPVVVVSNRPAAGALERAGRLGVPAEVLPHGRYPSREDHERALLELLAAHKVEMIALAGYMRILTGVFLEAAPGPIVNIHPVPTHLYQGPAGYEDVWSRRERLGANFPTVHLVDAGVDTGRVVLYGLPYRVSGLGSPEELRQLGLAEEHELYPEAIRHLLALPKSAKGEMEESSSELSGVSTLRHDLLSSCTAARKSPGLRVVCMAQRDWQGTGYRIWVEGGRSTPARQGEPLQNWLAGTERTAFTKLLLELLPLAAELPVELLYEGLAIDLTDTRRAAGAS